MYHRQNVTDVHVIPAVCVALILYAPVIQFYVFFKVKLC